MSSFENNIKTWVNIDNQIKSLNEKARELREQRNELCDQILNLVLRVKREKQSDAIIQKLSLDNFFFEICA